MDSISTFFSYERDAFYLIGLDKGEVKAKEQQTKVVVNLLIQSDFTVTKIAEIADVTVDFVKAVQQKISGNN